jgi:hypothetical protein
MQSIKQMYKESLPICNIPGVTSLLSTKIKAYELAKTNSSDFKILAHKKLINNFYKQK